MKSLKAFSVMWVYEIVRVCVSTIVYIRLLSRTAMAGSTFHWSIKTSSRSATFDPGALVIRRLSDECCFEPIIKRPLLGAASYALFSQRFHKILYFRGNEDEVIHVLLHPKKPA